MPPHTTTPQTPLDTYIDPARHSLGWWRPVCGLLVILLCWVLGAVLAVFLWLLLKWLVTQDLNAALGGLQTLGAPGTAEAVMVMLATFCGIWGGIAIALAGMHNQPFGTIFAPRPAIRLGAFARGVLLALGFSAISMIVAIGIVGAPSPAVSPGNWVLTLLPLAALIFVQATGEELIFRGYLLQQLAIRFRSPLAWAVLPSALFGAMHAGNAEGDAALYYMAITAITGITLAALVWRTGNLWAAIGVHWVVNVLSLTGVGAEGVFTGTQLWLFPAEALMPLLQLDLVMSIALLAAVLSPAGRWLAPTDAGGR